MDVVLGIIGVVEKRRPESEKVAKRGVLGSGAVVLENHGEYLHGAGVSDPKPSGWRVFRSRERSGFLYAIDAMKGTGVLDLIAAMEGTRLPEGTDDLSFIDEAGRSVGPGVGRVRC